MPTVRIQEKNYSESIMVLKLKDGDGKLTCMEMTKLLKTVQGDCRKTVPLS